MTDATPDTKRYYVTTPIYYVNGSPHTGTATTTLLADATTRYHKLRGDNPFFLTGTDENARKVLEAAQKEGQDPQVFVNTVSQRFVETWQFLNCDYDVFFRTTEPRHIQTVQEVFRRLKASGDIYLGTYEGWYSVSDETFFRDTDVDETTQTARETGAKVERVKEEAYFFKLSAYGDRLKAYIDAHADFLLPETRRNEVLAFIEQGLRDVAVTQNRTGWGIAVPDEAPGRVIYVWFDAVINYLTATGWPDAGYENLWPADVHLMGKEIYTRFHATLWPAMLMALGLPLPAHVVGHGFWLVRDPATDALIKGSKSTVPPPRPQEAVAYLQEKSGAEQGVCVDAYRYYCLRDISYTSDAEFSFENMTGRYNADLANDLGNVLNRVLRAKYANGRVPLNAPLDAGLQAVAQSSVASYEAAMLRFDWGAALQSVWGLLGEVNKYLAATAPWLAAKAGKTDEVDTSVYNALECARIAAVLILPVMPTVAEKIAAQLGLAPGLLCADGDWANQTLYGTLPGGTVFGEAVPLFPRIDTKTEPAAAPKAAPKKEKTKPIMEPTPNPTATESAPETPASPAEDLITIDDFMRVKLRVADIISAEKVGGAKKLLLLQIRIGDEERQLVAGIAESYAPEDLAGRQIVVVANLQPAIIRGVQSQGMLLAATDAEGHAILLKPDTTVGSGAQVR